MAKNSKYDIHNDFNFNMAIMVTPIDKTIKLFVLILPPHSNMISKNQQNHRTRRSPLIIQSLSFEYLLYTFFNPRLSGFGLLGC